MTPGQAAYAKFVDLRAAKTDTELSTWNTWEQLTPDNVKLWEEIAAVVIAHHRNTCPMCQCYHMECSEACHSH